IFWFEPIIFRAANIFHFVRQESTMTKVCIVQKRQIVLLKKEIYVEGSQEEIEEWIIQNQLDDTKYQWRTHTEYIDPGHEEYEILEVPEDDGYDFLRYVRKPPVYNLERDNGRKIQTKK
ncbi:MAG: hypothetical protein ACO3LN_02425, partial [bacterium]